jgi:transposase-like protein
MEERKIGEQDGELKKAKEDARNFYNLGVDIEKIAQGVGYAVETVREWLGLES